MKLHLLLPALLLLSPASCRRPAPPAGEELPLVPRVDREAQVVARVNGVPILDVDLREQMRGSAGQSETDRRQALRTLIRAELLAQEAAHRGLARHPAVRDEQRRALANVFVHREFRFTPRDVPRQDVERAYQLNRLRYQRPEAVNVTHIVVLASARTSTPDVRRGALRLAQRIHAIAVSGRLSEKEFREIAQLVSKDAPTTTIKAETLTTPLRGLTVTEFADAAFALQRPGQVSPVVQTRFGYHVIYLNERLPPRNIALAQVEEEIRGRIFEETRQAMFLRWLEEIGRRHVITTRLDVVAQIRGGGPSSPSQIPVP